MIRILCKHQDINSGLLYSCFYGSSPYFVKKEKGALFQATAHNYSCFVEDACWNQNCCIHAYKMLLFVLANSLCLFGLCATYLNESDTQVSHRNFITFSKGFLSRSFLLLKNSMLFLSMHSRNIKPSKQQSCLQAGLFAH